jgi:hypothetical protein
LSEQVFKIEEIIMSEERKPLMTKIHLLKRRRREVKVDLKLGGQWSVPLFGGQWNVKEKHLHRFPISPRQNYLNL